MRIIAGKYKRSNLFTLEGLDTRPTKDMVKEAMFSSIDARNTSFLDLFSGSGSIGLEAISRGANEVIFNDNNIEAIKIIKANLDKFNENRRVLNLDYIECIDKLAKENKSFDYIFLDPPYSFNNYEDIILYILSNALLKGSGRLIIETSKEVDLKEEIEDLILYKVKIYGITKLNYYRHKYLDE